MAKPKKAFSAQCDKDLVSMKDVHTETFMILVIAGCNLMVFILNCTILFAIIFYLKPTIAELRKQTFVIMDSVLLSYMPGIVRKALGCKSNPGGDKKKKVEKPGKSGTTGGTE